MKDENKSASIPTPTFAYLAKLLHDTELLALLDELRKKYLEDSSSSSFAFEKKAAVKKEIRALLNKKSVPLNFVDVLYSIAFGKEPKYPLSPTISIEAADQPVADDFQLLLVRDENGNLTDKPEISIKIHANISVDELIKFIESKKELLNELMLVLKLPQIPTTSRWSNIRLALLIISMKDEEHLSFSQISSSLASHEGNSEEETNYISNESNVKNLYYRYKKYLSSP